ncbi:MAG: glycoside hydrolase family 25 protein [Bacteroidota bacterium]
MAKRSLKKRRKRRIKRVIILLLVSAFIILITRPDFIPQVKQLFFHSGEERITFKESKSRLSEYSVFGLDVSEYQDVIVWKKLDHQEDLDFVFIRASAGKDKRDRYYSYNWRETGRVGMIRGAYHYYRPDENSIEQANNFIRQVELSSGDLPPVLDIEDYSEIQSLHRLKTGLLRWLEIVEAHYGVQPIIYTYYKFYLGHLAEDERFEKYVFWLARYGQQEKLVAPGVDWAFWQFTQTGILPGVAGDVDLNVFRYDIASLEALRIQ